MFFVGIHQGQTLSLTFALRKVTRQRLGLTHLRRGVR
jgi:hypothetical protein